MHIIGNRSKYAVLLRGTLKTCRFGLLIALFPLAGQAQVLEQLISSSLSSHPATQVQQELEESARAGVESANWQFFPTPSVAVEKAQSPSTDPSYRGDDVVSTIRLHQLLWTGGRLSAGVDKAEASLIVSQASLAEVRQQLALRVVQAYGDWLAAHLKTEANEKSLATHLRLRDQVKRRIEQGVSAESDLILAHGHLKSVAVDLSLSRAQRDIALARLGELVGHPVDDTALGATVATPRPVSFSLQKLLELALSVNPTIQKLQAQAKVHEAEIDERRADLSPEVYLNAERQYGNYSVMNTAPANRLFLGFSTRFGAGLSNLSTVEGAKSQHRAALADVEAQTRTVREEVLADYALVVSSKGRLESANASLEAAGQVYESYGRQFLAGHKSWQDVMNAAREMTQIEVQLADILSTQIVVTWRMAIYTDGIPLRNLGRRDVKPRDQLSNMESVTIQEPIQSASAAAIVTPVTDLVLSSSPIVSVKAAKVQPDIQPQPVEVSSPLVAAESITLADGGGRRDDDRARDIVPLRSARSIKLPALIKETPIKVSQNIRAKPTLHPSPAKGHSPPVKKHRGAVVKSGRVGLKAHGKRKE